MSTIKRYLLKENHTTGKCEIALRLSVNGNTKHRLKSGLFVAAKYFDVKSGSIKRPRINNTVITELTTLERDLTAIETKLILYVSKRPTATKQELQAIATGQSVEQAAPTQPQPQTLNIWLLYDEFINTYNSESGDNHRHTEITFKRYCAFQRYFKRLNVENVTDITPEFMKGFAAYLKSEKTLLLRYPTFAKSLGELGKNQRINDKHRNSIAVTQMRLNTFFNWLLKRDLISANPLAKIDHEKQEFATPYYLTLDERNAIANHDLSSESKATQIARDVFLFHCYVGCRYSDLYRLTAANVVGNYLQYIPTKTKGSRATVVRVPLTPKAVEIIEKYKGKQRKLLPVKSIVTYNRQIKKLLTICGITRNVIKLDNNGNEISVPINTVASSHTARKTFIGNLYKKVSDPNLIASMSGHTENSTAFARYRVIDDQMKQNVIALIE